MRMIDQEYMRHPCKGQRQMVSYLERQGIYVNRKRIKRLMKNMGLEALSPKPRTHQRKTAYFPTCYEDWRLPSQITFGVVI